MILTEDVLVIEKNRRGFFELRILMPDKSRNYLHCMLTTQSIENAVIMRELLLDQEFYSQELTIIEDKEYFRLNLTLRDANSSTYLFHSRKLNIIDAVAERDILLK